MSKDPGYSDSRKDTLESSNRSLRAELEKLQAENVKLRTIVNCLAHADSSAVGATQIYINNARQLLKELGDV